MRLVLHDQSGDAEIVVGRQAQQGQRVPVNNPNGGGESLIPSQRGSASFAKASAPKPRVRAIPWSNRVLVVATPEDMEYVSGLISHLDAPVESFTDILNTALTLFIILLVTDILCLTSIFRFTRCAR